MANLADVGTQVACAVCAFNPLCDASAAAGGAASPAECRRRVPAGSILYTAGSPRDTIYALRAGIAQVSIERNGATHVVRFLLPGDAAGLDAFAGGVHENEVASLEDCEVCVIPTHRVEITGKNHEATCALLRTLLARQLAGGEQHAAMLAQLDARQRVARFLLELSRRWAERGYSPAHFRLPMGRRAIGQHLALTTETVSRVLSDFHAHGWVGLPWREVRILQPDRLEALLPQKASEHLP